jgi:hypothetical protein
MKAFLIALIVGAVTGVIAVASGASPANFAYGKVAPYILAFGFVGGAGLAWFPLELFFRRIDRRRFDGTLLISAAPFCLALFSVGSWAVGRYSDRIEIQKIMSGGLNSKEQMAVVSRYQSHFGRGGGPAHDWQALMELARSPSTDPEVLRVIATNDEFTQFLGRNPNTPDDILESYAKDRNRSFYLKDNPKWKGRIQ